MLPVPPPSASGGDLKSEPVSTPAKQDIPERVVEVPDKLLDLSDDSIYFIIIDGVKFNLLEVTVKDFLDAGFTINKDKDYNENTSVDAKTSFGSLFACDLYKEGSRKYFSVTPVNLSDKSVPLKDCEISGIQFDERIGSEFDIATVCNLSYGCKEGEVKSVFGESHGSTNNYLSYSERKMLAGKMFDFQCSNGTVAIVRIYTDKSPY